MPSTFSIRFAACLPAALCLLIGLACEPDPGAPAGDERPPNFVFVFADDLGYGDLSSYGSETIRTPHLDSLAAAGIRFTDFYAAAPVCSPSRAALLTGRYPVRDGIGSVFFPESWTGLDPDEITLAEVLQDAGYATAAFGKWHLGHHLPYLPLQQGFDAYFGIPYSNDMEAVVYLRGNEVVEEHVDQRYTVQRYTEEALSFIERNRDRPFFLYLPHSMPHVPIYASDAFQGRSDGGLYGDVIEEIDWSVGAVVAKLRELGIEDETIVVFTSDNGPWLEMIELGGSAGPLRLGKGTTFEGGMRVPTILQWKSRVAPGQVATYTGTMMDWFPTFIRLAGATMPDDRPIDGLDLSAVLTGEAPPPAGREFAYYRFGVLEAYRAGNWKLKLPNADRPRRQAIYSFPGEPVHDLLLFNLRDDIGEQHNLAEAFPDTVRMLEARIDSFLAAVGEMEANKIVRAPADKSHLDSLQERYEPQPPP